MDPYNDIDEMTTIYESSDEEGSLYDTEKERNAIEKFVDTVFKETSPKNEVIKEEQVEEKIKEKVVELARIESKLKKIKHPFPFRKISLFDRL